MVTLRNALRRWRRPDPLAERELDFQIHAALRDEALAQPPGDAWERLRATVHERQSHSHGMWVLDQPLHEPREAAPVRWAWHDARRTVTVRGAQIPYRQWQARETLWSTRIYAFSALLNF